MDRIPRFSFFDGPLSSPHADFRSRSFFSRSPTYVIRSSVHHLGGDSKAWLRLHASSSTPIFTTGDNQIYSYHDLVLTLEKLGFRYVLDTIHWEQRYWPQQALLRNVAASENPEAISFIGLHSQVIDLKILKEAIVSACFDVKETEFKFLSFNLFEQFPEKML